MKKYICFYLATIFFSGCKDENISEVFRIDAEVSHISCNGTNDGTIRVSAKGGTPPYIYSWTNGYFGAEISNLRPGSYSVFVTDNLGQEIWEFIEVKNPNSDLVLTTEIINPDAGEENGMIALKVSGGTPPYSFEWSNGSTTQSTGPVKSGKYFVKVNDANSLCKSSFIMLYGIYQDTRDGYKYKTLNINEQVWFAENLRTTMDQDGNKIERYCLFDQIENCEENGGMYNIYDVQKKLCPEGWHISTEKDWRQLEKFLGVDEMVYENPESSYWGRVVGKAELVDKLVYDSTNITQTSSGLRFILGGYRDYYGTHRIRETTLLFAAPSSTRFISRYFRYPAVVAKTGTEVSDWNN